MEHKEWPTTIDEAVGVVLATFDYALASGKKVCGYVVHMETVVQRVERLEQRCEPPVRYGEKLGEKLVGREGMLIDDFGLPRNLTLAVPVHIAECALETRLQAIAIGPR